MTSSLSQKKTSHVEPIENDIQTIYSLLYQLTDSKELCDEEQRNINVQTLQRSRYSHLSRQSLLHLFEDFRSFVSQKMKAPGLKSMLVNPHYRASFSISRPSIGISAMAARLR
jgi:hypothetical protein